MSMTDRDVVALPRRRLWPRPDPLLSVLAPAVLSFAAYILAQFVRDIPFATAIGVGACGWSYLLVRGLFQASRPDALWPLGLAVTVALAGAISVLAADGGGVQRVAGNVYVLSGSAALILAVLEPLQGGLQRLAPPERGFRVVFLAGYGALVAISTLGLFRDDTFGGVLPDHGLRAACAAMGLIGALAAVRFRLRHPLTITPAHARRPEPTADHRRLADRLSRLLEDQEIDRDPDLRISQVAARLGEPEHRLSQSISRVLGFPNFNRWINHHRVVRARTRLADPADRASILDIAMDCGFGSIGPFNRSFKAATGLTPRAFRQAARAADYAASRPHHENAAPEPAPERRRAI